MRNQERKITCVEIDWGGGDVPVDIVRWRLPVTILSPGLSISLGGDGPQPVDIFGAFDFCAIFLLVCATVSASAENVFVSP